MIPFGSIFRGKNILITGGLGFIGSNLARRLVSLNSNVMIIDSLIFACGGNPFNVDDIKGKITIDYSDQRDLGKMKEIVRNQDIVFNLAGSVSHLNSIFQPIEDMELNCKSHLSLLEACRISNPGVKIVYASTRQIYGRAVYLPVDEKHPLNPIDINGINKLAGEQYHRFYYMNHNIKTTSLRLTNTYGPRMSMRDDRQGFIAWWVRQVIDGNEIKIFGDGTQIRALNYIDDVVNAFLTIAVSAKTNGEIFNLGSKNPVSLIKLAEMLIDVNKGGNFRLISFPKEREKIDIGNAYTSYERIKETIGWDEKISLQNGLKDTIQYYKEYKEKYW